MDWQHDTQRALTYPIAPQRLEMTTGQLLAALASFLWSIWQTIAIAIVIFELGPLLGLTFAATIAGLVVLVRRLIAGARNDATDSSEEQDSFRRFAA